MCFLMTEAGALARLAVAAIDTTPALRARNSNGKVWHNTGASASKFNPFAPLPSQARGFPQSPPLVMLDSTAASHDRTTPVRDADMANAVRALAMDAVEQAKSGHPGMPMGMAEIAVALWTRHLRYSPGNPNWLDRDRFVLSNGHGSMLQYALLHLTGYDLPLEELQRFRQLNSKTPGHPEVGVTPGVETTTGPLGQGLANGVGMALAERLLAATFNRPGHAIVDHHTYVFAGDGCLMEGISHEACSLAERWGSGSSLSFTTTTGSRSTARHAAGSPTTRRGASKRTAGTSCRTSTATTSAR